MNPKAGTSRTVDTEPRVTWLGIHKLAHPPWCGVYRAKELNWAPYCTCTIRDMQAKASAAAPQRPFTTFPRPDVPMTDPIDVPWRTESRAPWWVWSLIGFGAGLAAGTSLAGWPW